MDFQLSAEQELVRASAREFAATEISPHVRDWDRAEEIGKADSSVRGVVSVNVGLVGKTIARFGTEEQKQTWLPRLASGEALGCYALTEPGCGSDAAALTTRAERDGDHWMLKGSKT